MCAEVAFSVAADMQRDNLLLCSRAVHRQEVSNLICQAKWWQPHPTYGPPLLAVTTQANRERIAGVSERVVGHIEAMCPDEILTRSAQFEKIDTIARRTFGLNDVTPNQGCLSLNILTNHSIVQVASLPTDPSPAE